MTKDAEIAKLKRKVDELEKMLLPEQVAVYRAAMLLHRMKGTYGQADAFIKLLNACERAKGGK